MPMMQTSKLVKEYLVESKSPLSVLCLGKSPRLLFSYVPGTTLEHNFFLTYILHIVLYLAFLKNFIYPGDLHQ